MSGSELMASLYAAFAQGDVPTVLGAMDPQVQWREAEGNPYMPSGEAWVGPDAVVTNLFQRLATEWDGFAVHPARYHEADGVVTVEGRYSGTYQATGKAIDAQFCHVWTISGGRITNFQQYTDTGAFQDVMGAPN